MNETRECECMNNNMDNCMNNDRNNWMNKDRDNCMHNEEKCNCMNDRDNCNCMNNKETREELTKKIMQYKFAIIDISLYLNAHPNDKKALCLHNEYVRTFKELTDKYQKVYGPLTIEFPCNKWRWLEMPWPWEKGAY